MLCTTLFISDRAAATVTCICSMVGPTRAAFVGARHWWLPSIRSAVWKNSWALWANNLLFGVVRCEKRLEKILRMWEARLHSPDGLETGTLSINTRVLQKVGTVSQKFSFYVLLVIVLFRYY